MDREDISDDVRSELVDAVAAERTDGVLVEVGGPAFGVTAPGLSPLEGVGLLVALVVLLVTLGSARAASVPIASALTASALSLAVILALTAETRVSSTAPLLALMIGLAVGIDYALLIVSRHREHLAAGLAPAEAAARAVATAGSAVVFAGVTVIIAFLALAIARIPFLTVMGTASAFAVAVAVLRAVTALPALLTVAGTRLAPRARRPRGRATTRRSRSSSSSSASASSPCRPRTCASHCPAPPPPRRTPLSVGRQTS